MDVYLIGGLKSYTVVELEQYTNNAVTMFLEDNIQIIRFLSLNNASIAVVCITEMCKLSNVSIFGLHLYILINLNCFPSL